MDQSISGQFISVLTFEEPSPHICGDGAGAVWQFHHTEAFLPFPCASTTPDQGSGASELGFANRKPGIWPGLS